MVRFNPIVLKGHGRGIFILARVVVYRLAGVAVYTLAEMAAHTLAEAVVYILAEAVVYILAEAVVYILAEVVVYRLVTDPIVVISLRGECLWNTLKRTATVPKQDSYETPVRTFEF